MNQAALTIPSSVAVPAGSISAAFSIKTSVIKHNHPVTLQASLNGSSVSTVVTVEP